MLVFINIGPAKFNTLMQVLQREPYETPDIKIP